MTRKTSKEHLRDGINNIINQEVGNAKIYFSGNAAGSDIERIIESKNKCLEKLKNFIEINTYEVEYVSEFKKQLEDADWSSEQGFNEYLRVHDELMNKVYLEIAKEEKERQIRLDSLSEANEILQLKFIETAMGEAFNSLDLTQEINKDQIQEIKTNTLEKFEEWFEDNKGHRVMQLFQLINKFDWSKISNLEFLKNNILGSARNDLKKLSSENKFPNEGFGKLH